MSHITSPPLSPLLYTYDCKAMSESKFILKFTDDNFVVGPIPLNDETNSSPGGQVLGEPLPAECPTPPPQKKATRQHLYLSGGSETLSSRLKELLILHPRELHVWEHHILDGKLHQK